MTKSKDSFTFTVGKLDAGMAILIGDKAHLIEFPSILLPPGVSSGSIVNIAVHRNVAEENRQKEEFWKLQEDIYQTFGTKTPETPDLQLRNVTQTSVTLEWAPIEAATAKIRSLDIFKNGQRVGAVPSPLRDTYTRLSGLEVDKDYTFQLILRTTAGTYPSNVLRVRTHTIHDTSGISVCFGNVEDPVMLEQAKEVLDDMKAKWSDKIQIDTTHFVCSTPNNPTSSPTRSSAELGSVEYQRAVQMSIPIVQPHWLFSCHKEKKMVPIANFYLGTKQTPPSFTRPQSLQLSRSQGSSSPSSTVPNNHRASMPVISTTRSDSSTSVNQEEEDKAAAIRKGIMNKEFKFPRAPAISEEPSAEADKPSDDAKEEAEETDNKPFQVTPPEVFTPPVVSKDEEPVAEAEYGDDDVGPTVEVDLSHSDAVWGIRWTAKDTVISISADGSIAQWDSSTGRKLSSLPPHTLGLVSLSVSEAGDYALFNTLEGLTKLWNLTDGSIVGSHESFAKTSGKSRQSPVWAVSLHPNAQSYASTGSDGAVTIRSASSSDFGSGIHSMSPGKTKYGMSLAHSPDGSKIALSSETGQIYMFDLESSQLLNTYTSHAMCVRSLAWSPDSQLLVSASDDKRIIIHDVRNAGKGGGAVASLTGHSSWVLNASISPDAKLIVSGSADRTIKIWDMAARTAVSTIQDTNEIWTVSWRPKASSSGPGAFVSGSDDGTIKWWRGAGPGRARSTGLVFDVPHEVFVMSSPKVALVTGCTTGSVGFSYCEGLLKRGYIVYATSRSLSTVQGLEHPNVRKLTLDVTNDDHVAKVVQTIIEEAGQIDLLVNNAGVLSPGPIIDHTMEEIIQVYNTNIFSQLRLAKAVIPHMTEKRSGMIINMGSVVGEFPTPWMGVYDSSKAAVRIMTEVLALECRPFNIHVVLVSGASIKSTMVARFDNYQLRTTSPYHDFAHNVRQRLDAAKDPNVMMDPGVFTENVLNKTLNPAPVSYLLLGGNSIVFRIMSYLPRKWVLNMVWKTFSKPTAKSKTV